MLEPRIEESDSSGPPSGTWPAANTLTRTPSPCTQGGHECEREQARESKSKALAAITMIMVIIVAVVNLAPAVGRRASCKRAGSGDVLAGERAADWDLSGAGSGPST
jgi:hypothetical protein